MKTLSAVVILFLASMSIVSAQTTNYQVHSIFVFNIAKYSTWPTTSGDFTIVVFGKSKIHEELTKQFTGKQVNGMAVKVVQVDDINQIGSAQIVFLADGKSGTLADILKVTDGKSTMVIAEREGLFRKGASFSFVIMENNTLRFDINHAELDKRSIKVSKNLTSLANTVI